MISEKEIEAVGKILNDRERPLKERFRALFTLQNFGGKAAIDAICSCFDDPSCLLKHELAYCLGQMGDIQAVPRLIEVLEDALQEPMVRHEAGEALGAIGDPTVLPLLMKYCHDSVVEVAETCQLAVARIRWLGETEVSHGVSHSNFTSVDPAPPAVEVDMGSLRETLLDESLPLFDRYRAMFALRNLNTTESARAIADGFQCSSALFRHEVGYVLGQMCCDGVVEQLSQVVQNTSEHEMVRHEAAEALGSIATEGAIVVLKEYLSDDAQVVRESCQVALDISDYQNNSEFQYASGLLKVEGV